MIERCPFFQARMASHRREGWGISEPPTHMQMRLSPLHQEPLPPTPPSTQRRKQGTPGRACSRTHPVRNQLAAASWGYGWLQAGKPWKKEESSPWGVVPPFPNYVLHLRTLQGPWTPSQIPKERWAELASEDGKDSPGWGSGWPESPFLGFPELRKVG